VRALALAVRGRGLVDPDEPLVHWDDVGLTRGQAAFETIRVYGGRPFGFEEHVDRIVASAASLELPAVDRTELVALAAQALDAAGEPDVALRLYWTGGRDGAGEALVMAAVSPIPSDLEALRARGLRAISLQLGVDARRRAASPWLLSGVKSTSYAINMAARAEAIRRGADDAVFIDTHEIVLEGTVTNVWWRREEVLRTPAIETGILAGVTRAHVAALAADLGYSVEEGWFPLADLAAADEAFTSSSVREIMPIVELDGRPIGSGRPTEAAARVQSALRRAAQPTA
jgi:4-amino-4-deoxychorismate lyase